MTYECPEKIYKYLDVEGLIATLEGRTLKFSRPSDFNDPFDIYLQEALGVEDLTFLEGMKEAFYNFITGDDEFVRGASVRGITPEMMKHLRDILKNGPAEKIQKFKVDLLETPINDLYDIERIKRINKEVLDFASNSFLNDGVFCVTTDKNNLLMWAHYAEKHKGAILEFSPDVANDSILLASRPVLYSDKRPLLYRSPEDMIFHGFAMTQEESMSKILDGLVYTKSVEWGYEREYRCYVPKLISKEKPFELLKFGSQELAAVYLGCKMAPKIKSRVIDLAKKINPAIKIYQADVARREYQLHYNEVLSP